MDAVAAGNDVLAGVARASAQEVVVLPTSIDTASYQPSFAGPDDPPTIAWIGSPENLIYLDMIRPALARLSKRHPALKLRVICSAFPDWGDVQHRARTLEFCHRGAVVGRRPHRGHAADR